jgi:hypothetical protein
MYTEIREATKNVSHDPESSNSGSSQHKHVGPHHASNLLGMVSLCHHWDSLTASATDETTAVIAATYRILWLLAAPFVRCLSLHVALGRACAKQA